MQEQGTRPRAASRRPQGSMGCRTTWHDGMAAHAMGVEIRQQSAWLGRQLTVGGGEKGAFTAYVRAQQCSGVSSAARSGSP
eukprot:10365297-Prorocentrum_lima.AAC.1